MTNTDRTAAAREAYPIGTQITTAVHSIGGRSEDVTGAVIDHKRGELIVSTADHGRICVALDRVKS